MDSTERYLFDLQGFIVVEHAIAPEHLQTLNAVMDAQLQKADRMTQPWVRFNGLLHWHTAYQALIDNPRIMPYLVELLGNNLRLDHDYAHVIRRGLGPIGAELHGGGVPFDPCQYYMVRDGRMHNGLTAVAYQLTDVKPGEGGFGCIPGSHKSHFPLPQHWRNLENPPACSVAITPPAGSAIIFTEALTHGTLPWRGNGERRTLFYKYSPFPSAWSARYYNPNDYPNLTEAQRAMLKPPSFYWQHESNTAEVYPI